MQYSKIVCNRFSLNSNHMVSENCDSSSSNSSEISSTLSGIDDEFWNSKIPQCSICYLTKNDLSLNIEMLACK